MAAPTCSDVTVAVSPRPDPRTLFRAIGPGVALVAPGFHLLTLTWRAPADDVALALAAQALAGASVVPIVAPRHTEPATALAVVLVDAALPTLDLVDRIEAPLKSAGRPLASVAVQPLENLDALILVAGDWIRGGLAAVGRCRQQLAPPR